MIELISQKRLVHVALIMNACCFRLLQEWNWTPKNAGSSSVARGNARVGADPGRDADIPPCDLVLHMPVEPIWHGRDVLFPMQVGQMKKERMLPSHLVVGDSRRIALARPSLGLYILSSPGLTGSTTACSLMTLCIVCTSTA